MASDLRFFVRIYERTAAGALKAGDIIAAPDEASCLLIAREQANAHAGAAAFAATGDFLHPLRGIGSFGLVRR